MADPIQNKEILSVTMVTNNGNNTFNISYSSIKYLYLVEDLYSFSITGKMRFIARGELMEIGSITGNEKIIINYGNAQNDKFMKTIVMDVYKIDKVEPLKNTRSTDSTTLEIVMVDEYFKLWNFNVWSKGWKDAYISDIIKDISKTYLDIPSTMFSKFEDSFEKIRHFDTHLRTPAECIQWLMSRASSRIGKNPGFLFYRTSADGFKFNFQTLETLLSNKKLMEPKGDDFVYQFEQANPNYVNKIKESSLSKVDLNALRSLTGGTLTGYDIQRKKVIITEFTYKEAVNKFTILGSKSLFPENIGIVSTRTEVDGSYDEGMISNLWYGNWIKEYCNQQLLEVIVSGHEDRHAGGMINILWPSYDTEKEILNKQMRGKYLVKSVTNYFSNEVEGGWVQKMSLIKNGYHDSPNKNLLDSNPKKRNM